MATLTTPTPESSTQPRSRTCASLLPQKLAAPGHYSIPRSCGVRLDDSLSKLNPIL